MIDSDAMLPARLDPSEAVCQAPPGNVVDVVLRVDAIHAPMMPSPFQRQAASVLVGWHG